MTMKHSISFIAAIGLFIILGIVGTRAYSSDDEPKVDTNKILTAKFDARQVVQIESGDFHFKPWQVGPIHTHPAVCVGYVTKGGIIFQVEGEKPQIIRSGDVFYEPTGPRIMRFDNTSATTETIFIDFCLEQVGEPFLVFEKEPTEFIDRRALPTLKLDSAMTIDQVEIFEHLLQPGGRKKLSNRKFLVTGYVAEGEIELRAEGKETLRIRAGENFYLPVRSSKIFLVNKSSKTPAKVITFKLQ
jgi:quercetin dioxygenase-like cupin family protein